MPCVDGQNVVTNHRDHSKDTKRVCEVIEGLVRHHGE